MESLIIIGVAVIGLTAVASVRGGPELAWTGYGKGLELAWSVLPNVALGFALAGLITVVVPSDLIGGLAIASVAGVLTPGGPFLQFPLIAALAKGGAGVGPLAAYLTARSLLSANRAIVMGGPVARRFVHRCAMDPEHRAPDHGRPGHAGRPEADGSMTSPDQRPDPVTAARRSTVQRPTRGAHP